jgi:hypothetical protein
LQAAKFFHAAKVTLFFILQKFFHFCSRAGQSRGIAAIQPEFGKKPVESDCFLIGGKKF